jgi:hypothetical protein
MGSHAMLLLKQETHNTTAGSGTDLEAGAAQKEMEGLKGRLQSRNIQCSVGSHAGITEFFSC